MIPNYLKKHADKDNQHRHQMLHLDVHHVNELELLEIMDEARKREHMTRSGWMKSQIRKTKKGGLDNFLLGDY